MTIIAADVFWSDMLLGAVCVALSLQLAKRKNDWARLFLVLAFATFFGAFYHGLLNTTATLAGDILWSITLFWFALASLIMVDESFGRNKQLRVGLLLALVGYMAWAIFVSEAFLWALILQGAAVVALVCRYFGHLRRQQTKRRHQLDWLLIGFLAINIGAVALQQTKINFGLPISHNTIFHILELPVMLLLFYFVRNLDVTKRSH